MTPLHIPLRGRAWNEPEQAATQRAAAPHAQASPPHPVDSLSILGVWLWDCVRPIVGKQNVHTAPINQAHCVR